MRGGHSLPLLLAAIGSEEPYGCTAEIVEILDAPLRGEAEGSRAIRLLGEIQAVVRETLESHVEDLDVTDSELHLLKEQIEHERRRAAPTQRKTPRHMEPWAYWSRQIAVIGDLDSRADILADEEHAAYCLDRPRYMPAGSMRELGHIVGESTTWVG